MKGAQYIGIIFFACLKCDHRFDIGQKVEKIRSGGDSLVYRRNPPDDIARCIPVFLP